MQRGSEGSSELQEDRGKHSKVYLTQKYAIKVFDHKFRYNFEKEAKFLTLLQPFGFVPKLYFIDNIGLKIVMERICGKKISEAFSSEVVEKCLDICFLLDTIGIQKEEMTHPQKHILVSNSKVFFIDFERSVMTSKPANVTQFCTYLRKMGVDVPVELLRAYKRKKSRKDFLKIKENVLKVLDQA